MQVGDGYEVQGQGSCKGVEQQLQDIKVIQKFCPIKLGSAYLILGMQWLESLGNIATNWQNLTMKFKHEGRLVCLRGDPTVTQTIVSLKSMVKTMESEKERMWL